MNAQNDSDSTRLAFVGRNKTFFLKVMRGSINRRYVQPNRRSKLYSEHPLYYILFYRSGEGSILLGRSEHPVETGRVLLVGPGEPHSFYCLPNETARYDEVVFEVLDQDGVTVALPFGDLLSEFFGRQCNILPGGWRLPRGVHGEVKEAMVDVVKGCLRMETMFRMQFSLLRIFTVMERYLFPDVRNLTLDKIERAHQLLQVDTVGSFTLKSLAEEVGLTPAYLSNAYKARYGVGPIHYQRRVRLRAAASLLKTTGLPVKAIAYETGFSSPQHLNKVMLDCYGLTPLQYREKQ